MANSQDIANTCFIYYHNSLCTKKQELTLAILIAFICHIQPPFNLRCHSCTK